MEPLKLGDSGKPVQKLQQWLVTLGYTVPQDGHFGPEDEKAIKDFQSSFFMPVTGQVDEALFNTFKRLAKDPDEFTPKVATAGISTLSPVPLEVNIALPELKKIGGSAEAPPEVAQASRGIADKAYTSLAEGKAAWERLMATAMPAAQKTKLAAALKKKVVIDVYGKAYKSEIDQLRTLMQGAERWLMPEGQEAQMQLMMDSENLFNDGFYRKGIYYNYTVERIKGSDSARLTVKAVKNNMSNLVYSGTVKATEINPKEIDLQIFLAKNVGYTWQESKADFLAAKFLADKDQLQATAQGVMSTLRDSNHGYPPADVLRKAIANNFSVKNAIKTSVRYFILDYNKALKSV